MHQFPKDIGWIEVICGSMFSGKTEELIRRLKRVLYAKQKVQVFKPNIDNRYDEIAVVSQAVFPVAPLPDAALAFAAPALGNQFALRQRARKSRLDQPPAGGEIAIVVRQSPDRMQVTGQDDDTHDRERRRRPRVAKRGAQGVDVFGPQAQPALRQIDGEEEAAAGDTVTPLSDHRRSLAKAPRRWVSLRSTHPTGSG